MQEIPHGFPAKTRSPGIVPSSWEWRSPPAVGSPRQASSRTVFWKQHRNHQLDRWYSHDIPMMPPCRRLVGKHTQLYPWYSHDIPVKPYDFWWLNWLNSHFLYQDPPGSTRFQILRQLQLWHLQEMGFTSDETRQGRWDDDRIDGFWPPRMVGRPLHRSFSEFRYPPVNVYITVENHHFQWKNPLIRLGHFQ